MEEIEMETIINPGTECTECTHYQLSDSMFSTYKCEMDISLDNEELTSLYCPYYKNKYKREEGNRYDKIHKGTATS